ncbi:MAG TPA: TrmH family RNA methyltransferase, partial [Vicinamibacteria bacterium]
MIVLDPSHVDVVLVRPARPANVALACRAMKCMGLRRLWLVGGGEAPFSEADRGLAYGAWDVLDDALRVASLAEAVSGSVLVAATSGRVFEGEVWSARDFAQGG